MIYFSEVKGKQILSDKKQVIGRLEDLIFLAADIPKITKIVLQDTQKQKLIIPAADIIIVKGAYLSDPIVVKHNYSQTKIEENELHLVKNLLDKQIIDLVGNKVVRVNDVAIQDTDLFYISGVDIGLLGIFRWFKLDELIIRAHGLFNIKISPKLLSWADIQPLELSRGQVVLKKQEAKLKKIKPEDLADYLEKTNIGNVRKILPLLTEEQAADVISNLNINYQTSLFLHFDPQDAARCIKLIEPDEAADILIALPSAKRQEILNLLPEAIRQELINLVELSNISTIGDLITTQFVSINPGFTAKEVINIIKKNTQDFACLNYIYVINAQSQLVGVFNLHELLLQDNDTPVYKFMRQNLIVIHLHTPTFIAIRKTLKYQITALPVINNQKKMLGIVLIDDLADRILPKI